MAATHNFKTEQEAKEAKEKILLMIEYNSLYFKN